MKKIAAGLPFLFFLASVLFASADRDLIIAVAKGRFKTVVELIEKKKANVNATYDKGKTPLHWAVISGDLKMVAYLIAKGAKVESRDDYGDTPLHKAALRKTDNLDIIKYLAMKGSDINARNRYGWTPLHYFTFYENSLVVKYLLMQEAELTNTTSRKYMDIPPGYTALDIATNKNLSNIITALENPSRYRQMSKTPFLVLSVSNDFGPDNALIAPERGTFFIRMENRGGASANQVSLRAERITNTEGLELPGIPEFGLGPGGVRDFSVPVEALRSVRDGMAVFKWIAKDYGYQRESNPVTLFVRTFAPKPPLLKIMPAYPAAQSNARPALTALEKLRLPFQLENASSNGYADNLLLKGAVLSNGRDIVFHETSNLILKPLEKRTAELELEGGEFLADGRAKIAVIAEDLNFHTAATNMFFIDKKRLLRPKLTAEFFYRVTAVDQWKTNIERHEVYFSNGNILTDTNSAAVTNWTVMTNARLETNVVFYRLTNIDSGFLLRNTGEAGAKNVTAGIQAAPAAAGETNGQKGPVSLYQIPWMETNTARVLPFTNFIRTAGSPARNILFLRAWDERKLSVLETNITAEAE